jgi:D-alanine-D-alanine ligase-like ATP-grasp enzyme
MNTIYTRTITDEAKKRGINVEVIDRDTPIFILRRGSTSVRCYNALTDRVGAVSFYLADDKHLANRFIGRYGFPVPRQIKYSGFDKAHEFLQKCKSIVVKPCRQWGGRGVAVAVRTVSDLRQAILRARKFGEDIILEECVEGEDNRLIFVGGEFVAAIRRVPASVTGNGKLSIRKLIKIQNAKNKRNDAGNIIPLDNETRRALASFGLNYNFVPQDGQAVQVRRTSNFHTGGTVDDITETVDPELVRQGRKIAKLFAIPVIGIDFLVNSSQNRHWIIEVSADLAISPPEGHRVIDPFFDCLFPKVKAVRARPRKSKKRTG